MIYNKKDIWVGRSFDIYGEFSEAEVDLFRCILKPGDVVIDVGANIGSHTLAFSRLVGDQGTVIAFEPERNNFYTLCGNVAVNNLKHVFPFQQALSNQAGIINVPELDYQRTTNFGGVELDKDYSKAAHYPVVCTMLDDVGVEKCNLIKVDVEGMEKQVLEGGLKKIEKHKPFLYIEDDRQDKTEELRKLIKSLGYKMYLHAPNLFNKNNFYEEPNDVFGNIISINLFCHHESIECPPNVVAMPL
jgi:FkbM family methyltransferase